MILMNGALRRLLLGLAFSALMAAPSQGRQSPTVVDIDFVYTPYRRSLTDIDAKLQMKVVAIFNGNTIRVEYKGKEYLVRLLGLLCTDARVEAELDLLLLGQSVYLEYSPSGERDETGQLSAYVYRAADGLFVNLDLVARGFCNTANRLGPRPELFAASYRAAKHRGLGTWGEWDIQKANSAAEVIRRQQADLALAEKITRESIARAEAYKSKATEKYIQAKIRTVARTEARTDNAEISQEYQTSLALTAARQQSRQAARTQAWSGLYGELDGYAGGGSSSGGSSSGGSSSGGSSSGGFSSGGGGTGGRSYTSSRHSSGHYANGSGSSHRGGTYVNPSTNNHYQKRSR